MALSEQLSVYGFSVERLDAMVRWLNEQGVFRLEDLIGKCLVGMTALVIV